MLVAILLTDCHTYEKIKRVKNKEQVTKEKLFVCNKIYSAGGSYKKCLKVISTQYEIKVTEYAKCPRINITWQGFRTTNVLPFSTGLNAPRISAPYVITQAYLAF